CSSTTARRSRSSSRGNAVRRPSSEGSNMSKDRIRFTCPHCERRLRVAASAGGKRVRCPECRKAGAVPQESEPEEFDVDYRGYVTYKAAREELVSRLAAVAGRVGLYRCKYANPAGGVFTYTYDPSCYGGRRLYELTFRVAPQRRQEALRTYVSGCAPRGPRPPPT